ncbi:MAG: hypothetical protein WA215_04445 [Candidatus Cybelea sp.]
MSDSPSHIFSPSTASTDRRLVLSQNTSAIVHRGVPFIPAALRRDVSRHSIRSNYATNASLVFEGDQEETAVNVYQTATSQVIPHP